MTRPEDVFVPSVYAFRSQHTLIMNSKFQGLHRQFDVSDPIRVAETRGVMASTCATWHDLGDAGSVYMVIVYPSAFSDGVFPRRYVALKASAFYRSTLARCHEVGVARSLTTDRADAFRLWQ